MEMVTRFFTVKECCRLDQLRTSRLEISIFVQRDREADFSVFHRLLFFCGNFERQGDFGFFHRFVGFHLRLLKRSSYPCGWCGEAVSLDRLTPSIAL